MDQNKWLMKKVLLISVQKVSSLCDKKNENALIHLIKVHYVQYNGLNAL